MVTDKIKQLETTRAKLAKLEKSVAHELHKELAGLPAAYGFNSVKGFFQAVATAVGAGPRAKRGKAGRPKKAGPGRKRRRAVITEATRTAVKKLVEAEKTGAAIAKELRISLPSVQNIKKALGLVKARK